MVHMLELNELRLQLGDMSFCFSMKLNQGERLAILGPSGAGKSTLLNLIGGFLAAQSGTLLFNGADISHLSPAVRPVTSLFQNHNLFEHLSIFENVGLGLNPSLNLSKNERLIVSAALVQVGLKGYEKRMVTKLSGGQVQRVALARCLIRNKPILLLDEPFSALDMQTRNSMLEFTRAVVDKNNNSSLFVTHNEDDATRYATRIVHVLNGEIISN